MSKCIKHKKEQVVQYNISLMRFGTHNNAQCSINSFINRVFTVKLQYQPIQMKAWESLQTGGNYTVYKLLQSMVTKTVRQHQEFVSEK